ncbi:hypothetical protein LINGRAHAP2_LOCUS23880 [Linum grandiflorum]
MVILQVAQRKKQGNEFPRHDLLRGSKRLSRNRAQPRRRGNRFPLLHQILISRSFGTSQLLSPQRGRRRREG